MRVCVPCSVRWGEPLGIPAGLASPKWPLGLFPNALDFPTPGGRVQLCQGLGVGWLIPLPVTCAPGCREPGCGGRWQLSEGGAPLQRWAGWEGGCSPAPCPAISKAGGPCPKGLDGKLPSGVLQPLLLFLLLRRRWGVGGRRDALGLSKNPPPPPLQLSPGSRISETTFGVG